MKKGIICAAAVIFGMTVVGSGAITAARAEEKSLSCKAAYVMDEVSGVQLYAENEEKHLPIASMCKIMTLLMAFEAIDEGKLSLEDEITVSERASGMGGSQVFLGAGLTYRADELLKSIAVCSANDSCVAIAERISGSEGAFCNEMNERAKELGAQNTLFANCTGLPKEPQYSCAKDVAIMMRALHRYEKYHEYARVWLEDFAHPDGRTTQMTNTNKLIRSYQGCTGGKTGFTNEAGFCLAAAAERAGMQVISVVIGAESTKERFSAVGSLFDYAFDNFESVTYLKEGETAREVDVRGSRVGNVALTAEHTLSAISKRGTKENYTLSYELSDEVRAPVAKGDTLGYAVLMRDGVEVDRSALLASADAPKFTWWEAYREGARRWNSASSQ